MKNSDKYHERDLGVLFVHGIGNQKRGAILSELGDPIVNWFKGQSPRDPPVIVGRSTNFSPLNVDPAYVDLQFSDKRMLLTEAWWAESFVQPDKSALGSWLITHMPMSLAWHFKRNFSQSKSWWGKAASLSELLISVVLFPFISILCLLSISLSWIPLPYVQTGLHTVQYLMRSFIGDSFALIESPTRGSAMTQEIAAGLQWLTAHNCKRIAIVAHSQGAAVTHMFLASHPSSAPDCVVSLGSGLRKLLTLMHLGRMDKVLSWVFFLSMIIVSVCALFLILPFEFEGYWGTKYQETLYVVAVESGFFFVVSLLILLFQDDRVSKFLEKPYDSTWFDFYASRDPVSNGPLTDEGSLCLSEEVVNQASVFRDHSDYARNKDELIGKICAILDATGRLGRFDGTQRKALQHAAVRRRWRLGWRFTISAAWVSAVIFAHVSGYYYETRMVEIVRPLANLLLSAIQAVPFSTMLVPRLPGQGLMSLLLIFLIVYIAHRKIWSYWNRQEEQACTAGQRSDEIFSIALVMLILMVLITAALIIVPLDRGLIAQLEERDLSSVLDSFQALLIQLGYHGGLVFLSTMAGGYIILILLYRFTPELLKAQRNMRFARGMLHNLLVIPLAYGAWSMTPNLFRSIENNWIAMTSVVAIALAGFWLTCVLLDRILIRMLPSLRSISGVSWRDFSESKFETALEAFGRK